MHPDDITAARNRLNKAWIPLEDRFSRVPTPARTIEPEKASAPPVATPEPIGTSIQRQHNKILYERHKAAGVPPEEQCPKTGNAHRWNRWGRKNGWSKWRKRCRDCAKIVSGLTDGEYGLIEHNGGKKQRGEA